MLLFPNCTILYIKAHREKRVERGFHTILRDIKLEHYASKGKSAGSIRNSMSTVKLSEERNLPIIRTLSSPWLTTPTSELKISVKEVLTKRPKCQFYSKSFIYILSLKLRNSGAMGLLRNNDSEWVPVTRVTAGPLQVRRPSHNPLRFPLGEKIS